MASMQGSSLEEPDSVELKPVVELTPEQRLMQRIIPFFQLPGYETLPSTANVKARVDTHNTTYKRPRSAGPRLQNRHPKQDYSSVEAKVDTGRGSHTERKETHGAGGVVSHRRWATTGSHDVKQRHGSAGPSSVEARRTKVEKVTSDFSQVKAKVGSLQNTHHQPGGGNVKIKNYPKGVTVTAPKVDVRDTIKHSPGGGNVKILTNKTHHFRAEAKSKIDFSDPNPAHKLQRSINELSITGAKKLNPRFNRDLTKETLQTRRNIRQAKSNDSSNSGITPTKSATFPRSCKVPPPIAEDLSTDETSSSTSVAAEEIEDESGDSFTLNGQTEKSNHNTDGVVDGDNFDQDTWMDSGGKCATIVPEAHRTDSQPKTSAIISEAETLPDVTLVAPKETPTNISTSESDAAAVLVHLKKEDDPSTVDDHGGTGSENDSCELVEMIDTVVGATGVILPPKVVVYDEDETIIETIDAETTVQVEVEKTQDRTVIESSGHMYAPHHEQQDDDEQNRITRL